MQICKIQLLIATSTSVQKKNFFAKHDTLYTLVSPESELYISSAGK